MTSADRCPCGSGEVYGECCETLHRGAPAPTALALMRSRYTAHVTGDAEYLWRTWHPRARPASTALDPDAEWRRLEIVDPNGGGPFDDTGTVHFRAHYRRHGRRGVLDERSVFVREGGVWLYLDGAVD